MKKQFIAKLLVLAMVLSMVPAALLVANAAAGSGSGSGSGSGGYYTPVDTTVRVNEPVSSDGVIEVKVVNGTATVALSNKAVESLADLAKNGEIVLEIKAEGATRLNMSLPAKVLTEVAKETGADLTIKSPVANITIPNCVLTNEFTSYGSVSISAQATETSVSFSIQAGSRALKNVKGIKVEF